MTEAPFLPVLVFSGQRIGPGDWAALDRPVEAAIRAAMRARLVGLRTMIGYASARAGLDILFGEELVALGGELTLCLPCARGDFVAQYVAPAGGDWRARFEALCARAADVIISCEERLLGDETLLRFNNQMLQGLARLRAGALGVDPGLMVAWSAAAPVEPGSPAELMDAWPELSRLAVLDIDELREGAGGGAPGTGAPGTGEPEQDDLLFAGVSPRAIRAILFADIATFTRFDDAELPLIFDFLAEAQGLIDGSVPAPILINSWGDALHAASDTALAMADYALALTAAVEAVDPADFGLSARPRFRMALHAGPVFAGLNPLTGRSMIFGHHVNRAARIEPLAEPGGILASLHFVALLLAEQAAQADEARLRGLAWSPRHSLAYAGLMTLPKAFGQEHIFRILPVGTGAGRGVVKDGGSGPAEGHATGLPGAMRLALPPDLAQVPVLSARIEAFCALHGIDDAVAHAVTLAVDELVTNTILHGGLGDAGGAPPVQVALTLAEGALTVTLADRGVPFDPTAAPPPDLDAALDDRPIGGLGVHFVRSLMDGFVYVRAGDENRITLTRRLAAGSPAAGPGGGGQDTGRTEDNGHS